MRISDWSSDVCSSDLRFTSTVHRKRPGFPGLFLFMERRLASISPGEAAIEVMRSSALILVAWRHRFAAFFILPFLMRFVGRFLQDRLVIDPIDPARRHAVMRSMRVGIALGQDDTITGPT